MKSHSRHVLLGTQVSGRIHTDVILLVTLRLAKPRSCLTCTLSFLFSFRPCSFVPGNYLLLLRGIQERSVLGQHLPAPRVHPWCHPDCCWTTKQLTDGRWPPSSHMSPTPMEPKALAEAAHQPQRQTGGWGLRQDKIHLRCLREGCSPAEMFLLHSRRK